MSKSAGIPYIIAAPSGAGKTSLVDALLKRLVNLNLSVSYTTRPKRAEEQEGVNYHFVAKAQFEAMIAAGDFLEYAQVFDHYYGTSRQWIQRRLSAGQDVVLEIDWQGARKIKKALPESVTIFILPPSMQSLRERLMRRGQDDSTVIQHRMAQAHQEIAHYQEFDYVVINDHFEQSLEDLIAIVRSFRLTLEHQSQNQRDLLHTLLGDVAKTK